MLRSIRTALITALLLNLAACGGPKSVSPDETVKTAAKGISEKKPEIVWALLPTSYQNDLNGLLAALAAKTDPDLHAKSVETLNRLVVVLKGKKEFILGSPMLKQVPNVDSAKLKENYDAVVGIIDTVVKSDLSNLNALKKPDLGKIVKDTGGKLMVQISAISSAMGNDDFNKKLNELSKLEAKVTNQTDTTADMEITVEGQTKPVKMIKVEEKWVPEEMAKEWSAKMDEARKSIAETKMAENKLQVLGVLGAASTILEQLEKANSQQEFDQLLASALQNMR